MITLYPAWIYILMNPRNTVLYVGMTNDLARRCWEHKTGQNPRSFTSRYNVHKLVYFEGFDLIVDAIAREKYIKNQSRAWKLDLIRVKNPGFAELQIPGA